MAEENLSTGGDEIEYIPFYGELRMTTFTTEDRKEAAKKKPKAKTAETKAKEFAQELVEESIKEVVTARTEPITQEVVTENTQDVLQEKTFQEFENEPEYPDVPEPGVEDVALSIDSVDVIRRGFTTIHMAKAFRNTVNKPEDYLIVELRDVQNAILAYYVTHKREEL